MTFNRSFRRGGPVALLVAILAGASAPMAAGLPLLLASPPRAEVRRIVLDCPNLAEHPPAGRPAPWLARCGLVRRP